MHGGTQPQFRTFHVVHVQLAVDLNLVLDVGTDSSLKVAEAFLLTIPRLTLSRLS